MSTNEAADKARSVSLTLRQFYNGGVEFEGAKALDAAAVEIDRLQGIIAKAQDLLPKIIVTRTGEMKGYDKLHDLLSAALPGTDKEN